MLKVLEKTNSPKTTQNDIAKQIGLPDSTIERYRNDLNLNSLKNRNKTGKNTQRSSSTTTNIKAGKYDKKIDKNTMRNKIYSVKDQLIKLLIKMK